jgi:predicted regulator of Ras-like GTPase activity (Roadblock/LC7/MglB family)
MREVLDPLAHIPGVRLAALVSPDGVPIATARATRNTGEATATIDQDEQLNSYAALAAGWLAEVTRSALHQSWDVPTRAVLRATQGTLVLHHAPAAIVFAVLERGVPYEELRVPIDGAIARMQRMLRRATPEPRPPLPSQAAANPAAPVVHEEARKGTQA